MWLLRYCFLIEQTSRMLRYSLSSFPQFIDGFGVPRRLHILFHIAPHNKLFLNQILFVSIFPLCNQLLFFVFCKQKCPHTSPHSNCHISSTEHSTIIGSCITSHNYTQSEIKNWLKNLSVCETKPRMQHLSCEHACRQARGWPHNPHTLMLHRCSSHINYTSTYYKQNVCVCMFSPKSAYIHTVPCIEFL